MGVMWQISQQRLLFVSACLGLTFGYVVVERFALDRSLCFPLAQMFRTAILFSCGLGLSVAASCPNLRSAVSWGLAVTAGMICLEIVTRGALSRSLLFS